MRTIFFLFLFFLAFAASAQTAKDSTVLRALVKTCEKSAVKYTFSDGTKAPVYLSEDKNSFFVVRWDKINVRWHIFDPYSGWDMSITYSKGCNQ